MTNSTPDDRIELLEEKVEALWHILTLLLDGVSPKTVRELLLRGVLPSELRQELQEHDGRLSDQERTDLWDSVNWILNRQRPNDSGRQQSNGDGNDHTLPENEN